MDTESKARVLLVDDEPMNLRTFARAFRQNFEVRTAVSAEAALAELAAGSFDVIIADYSMPVTNGVQLLQGVRDRWPAILRLIISAHFELPEIMSAKRMGVAVDILPKPWDREQIVQLLTDLLRERAV